MTTITKRTRLVWPARITVLDDRCDRCGRAAPSALCDTCAIAFEASRLIARGAA